MTAETMKASNPIMNDASFGLARLGMIWSRSKWKNIYKLKTGKELEGQLNSISARVC